MLKVFSSVRKGILIL